MQEELLSLLRAWHPTASPGQACMARGYDQRALLSQAPGRAGLFCDSTSRGTAGPPPALSEWRKARPVWLPGGRGSGLG